ncbi:tigger transposable element-derived protein 6-like, partial [Vigna radiata var. radiata]|uniref:Tigger transposable element-derived protein 6-like n=1 Tax=Vigna radiata var. radiata TaxID=3916 RepID=A0A1S3T9R3_VIGRR
MESFLAERTGNIQFHTKSAAYCVRRPHIVIGNPEPYQHLPAMEADSRKRRRDLTTAEKKQILQDYDKLLNKNQRDAAQKLQIPQSTLCKLVKNRYEIEKKPVEKNEGSARKRVRHGKNVQVEQALKEWFVQVREKDARVNGPIMRQKAESLAKRLGIEGFVATDGWFNRWLKREGIEFKKPHGEARDADSTAAGNFLTEEWPRILSEYAPSDVYNADETALYFRALPEHTYVLKNETAKGSKSCKDRITILCCVSMTGEKKRLLVIGKSKMPRCLKNVKKLPADYTSSAKAWMTKDLFSKWLTDWDESLDRNILLLIDNCTAHNVGALPLKHIKVQFLPANTTSLIQPCDQGIIKAFKSYYRHEMRERIIDELDGDLAEFSSAAIAKKTDLLDSIHQIREAWDKTSEKTI